MAGAEKLSKRLKKGEAYYITGGANIFYYSGFTSEDACLIITENERILATDSRYTLQAKFESPDFEIVDIANPLKNLKLERIGFEADYLTYSGYKRLEKIANGAELFAADMEISAPRRIKSEEEINKIRTAESLGDAAFSYVLDKIRPGMTEREVAFEIETFMRKNGASGTSFETIAASGVRSALPHGTASEKVIERGDFLTLDFGCVLDGYCSDMTRTVAVGTASDRQREIYNTVLAAQNAAIEKIAPGVKCCDIDRTARRVIEEAGFGDYFGHSLGHSVGLEIHEMPCFSPKSVDITEPGNVITVEPGIYIEGFGGVRIEDVVAISPKNSSNLTKSEKDLIII